MLGLLGFAQPASAERRVAIDPYIEVQQVFDAELSGGGGEVLTYTSLAVGVDASVSTRRTEVQVSYRYERRIPWDDTLATENVHSGLARARHDLVPNLLTVEGGALATRARSELGGGSPEFLVGDISNLSQVYAFYAGPRVATTVGPLNVGASYRFGYVHAEESTRLSLPTGQPRLDRFDHATNHQIDASIGMGSGALPFGWTLSGGWVREDASQLSQRFDAKFARADIVLPVSYTLALTAGAGYEDIRQTQRDFLRDANGNAQTDANGRFIEDRTKPPLLAYDQDGLIYDAGVIWKPNRRTELQAKVGWRYGATFVTGSLDYRIGRRTALNVSVYNGIQSFGREVMGGLSGLPTSFEIPDTTIGSPFSGCVVGSQPGEGGCLGGALQSITTANFRSRGVSAILSGQRGPWGFGFGGGYAQRRYLSPLIAGAFSVDGIEDESIFLQARLDRALTPSSGIDAVAYANWLNRGVAFVPDQFGSGAALTYHHLFFDDRLTAQASAVITSTAQDGFEDFINASLLLGLRYTF